MNLNARDSAASARLNLNTDNLSTALSRDRLGEGTMTARAAEDKMVRCILLLSIAPSRED